MSDLTLDLLLAWEVIEPDLLKHYSDQAATPGQFYADVARYLTDMYRSDEPGKFMAWMPWAWAVLHREEMMEEMQDAARFSDSGSTEDEVVYQELSRRVKAIEPMMFLPDGVLHGRPDDSRDLPGFTSED